jgi:hypothetical protein
LEIAFVYSILISVVSGADVHKLPLGVSSHSEEIIDYAGRSPNFLWDIRTASVVLFHIRPPVLYHNRLEL